MTVMFQIYYFHSIFEQLRSSNIDLLANQIASLNGKFNQVHYLYREPENFNYLINSFENSWKRLHKTLWRGPLLGKIS